ncbi:ATP-binding cassette domain-containing protein [Sorangium sp. So ce513]|uniref:ATP-binding cassette domain-containing protein n=1 Tax=Sorangium sp. So ce513 TaxID=3133315 RepID=UPI003F5D6B72
MTPGAPIVVLEAVRARDSAGEAGRPRGSLFGATAALGPGVHAVLGAPEDGTLALAELLAGRAPPLAGRVLVAGREPFRSAPTRARIGVLSVAPELPDGASVASSMSVALRARGAPQASAAALLEALGVAPLLTRRQASLSFAEARAVELALALGVPQPLLLCLFEPFADVAAPSPGRVRERLRALADGGACVVLITSSTVDARALADRIHVLDRGVVVRTEPGDGERLAGAPISVAPGAARPEVELHVLVHERAPVLHERAPDAPGARALVAALAGSPAVRAAAWEPGPGSASSTLRIRAADREAAALAILDAAAREDVALAAISSPAPSMHDVRAATALHLIAARPLRPFGAPRGDAALPPGAAVPPGAAPLPGAPPQGPVAVAAFGAPPAVPPLSGPAPVGPAPAVLGGGASGAPPAAEPPLADGSLPATEPGPHDGR